MKTIIKMQFDPQIAKDVGVEEAIMYSNIEFWVKHNEANKINYHDGYYWTYNSKRAFTKLFTFWSERQIERILNNLERKGYIKTGVYNKAKYDKTKWFTVLDPNQKKPLPKQGEASTQIGRPIPDNKPDVIDISETTVSADTSENTNLPFDGLIFDFDKQIEEMKRGKLVWRRIIAEYWLIKRYNITTKEMFVSAQKRDTKAAKAIQMYNIDDLIGCMNWLQKEADYDWKLETVHKKIDWYLQNNSNHSIIELKEKRRALYQKCGKCNEGFIPKVINGYEEMIPCECIYSTISKDKLNELKKILT